MAKAKWLVEATDSELVAEIQAGLTNTEDTKLVNRAMKAADELIERTPQESDSPSVEEVITNMKASFLASADKLTQAYQSELEAIDPDVPEAVVEDDEEEVETEADDLDGKTLKELRAIAKDMGIKTKGLKKPDLISEISSFTEVAEVEEEFEEVADAEQDEVILEELTLKELRALAKEEGIKTKGLKKPDLIEALEGIEDDSEEDTEDDSEEVVEVEDYNDLSIKDLKAAARERGIRVTKGIKKSALVEALEADDEEA